MYVPSCVVYIWFGAHYAAETKNRAKYRLAVSTFSRLSDICLQFPTPDRSWSLQTDMVITDICTRPVSLYSDGGFSSDPGVRTPIRTIRIG